jgi:hypothetical protein
VTRSFGFVLAVPFGILLLWLTGLVASLLEGGECFGSDAECQPLRDAGMVHTQVLFGIVVGLTVLSVLAIAVGRRVVPAVLMGASIATLFLGFASFAGHAPALWWMPKGLFFTMPALVVLALASGGQVLDQRDRDRAAVGG